MDSAQEDGYSSDDIRTVSDDCDWKLVPEYNSVYPWDFDFSYEATITSPGKETPVEIASHQFEDRAKGLESGVASVEDEGEGAFSEFTDRSYFVYGASGSDSDKTTYVLLAQVKSVVYEVRMDATSDDSTSSLVPKSAFESEVKKLASRMEVDLGIWVPE
ncbi:hypothetical protein CDO52_06875 [Nocardiopsis gilva YIM 90087]|uniref:DUF3558 domain-containing protein n=1 Tax=Nocardiopsis gilva YIM 90087 TaxID=1235441 RepID=A0A223S330_9ACTN|nr:hypothetical protein CDO52_06875 [Nocardiopsis gilva YIM 90087]